MVNRTGNTLFSFFRGLVKSVPTYFFILQKGPFVIPTVYKRLFSIICKRKKPKTASIPFAIKDKTVGIM